MKSYKLLQSPLIFLLGLFAGLTVRFSQEQTLCLNATQLESCRPSNEVNLSGSLPIVAPILEKEAFTVVYDARCKNPYYVVETFTKDSLKSRHTSYLISV